MEEQIRKILDTMDVPVGRKTHLSPYGIGWLLRNLTFRNSNHPELPTVLHLLRNLAIQKGDPEPLVVGLPKYDPEGLCKTDHVTDSFTVVIRSLNGVSPEAVKILLQHQYEVVEITATERSFHVVPVKP